MFMACTLRANGLSVVLLIKLDPKDFFFVIYYLGDTCGVSSNALIAHRSRTVNGYHTYLIQETQG